MTKSAYPQLLFADERGKVFEYPALAASGMKAARFFGLDPAEFVKLPASSELFMLPDRHPVGFDPETGETVVLKSNPYSKKAAPCFAVAAFISPGYTLTHSASYAEEPGAKMLPLFAYAPCAYYKGAFYTSAIRVDKSLRHDSAHLDMNEVAKNLKNFKKLFPKNRLIPHLGNCATVNSCANAKNFFLGRFEVPVPTSIACNAQCQGCISFQPVDRIPSTQNRIEFVPTPEEIAEIALYHIERASDPMVSFGQGCEGEPTLSGDVIEKSIRLIRQKTSRGIININTNASRPLVIAKLFDAGLGSVRVSMNSAQSVYYARYYQPKGYSFDDVCHSIVEAKKRGGFVSVNYLSVPGFTDWEEEASAFKNFIREYKIDMIQWRNLNYDPLHYFRDLKLSGEDHKLLGMRQTMDLLRKESPRLRMGYFNPTKLAIST